MQVTLDIVDWNELLKFGSPRAFLDYLRNEENEPRWLLGADALGWESDSFLQYNEVAWAIEGILNRLAPSERQQVEVGLLPLISQGKQVDEFGMSPASAGHWFISASPATTRTIGQNLSLLDLPHLAALRAFT